MSDIDKARVALARLRTLASAATGGRRMVLTADRRGSPYCDGIAFARDKYEHLVETDSGIYPPSLDDARLIAAMSRENVLRLVAVAEAAIEDGDGAEAAAQLVAAILDDLPKGTP